MLPKTLLTPSYNIKMRKIFFVMAGIIFVNIVQAQELRARINVVANRVGSNVDKKVFQTLQTALNNFINNRKWTTDNFGPAEKIDCSFLLNLEQGEDANVYK